MKIVRPRVIDFPRVAEQIQAKGEFKAKTVGQQAEVVFLFKQKEKPSFLSLSLLIQQIHRLTITE